MLTHVSHVWLNLDVGGVTRGQNGVPWEMRMGQHFCRVFRALRAIGDMRRRKNVLLLQLQFAVHMHLAPRV